jgi:hypothetical protein
MKSIFDAEELMDGIRECVVRRVFKPSRPSQSPPPVEVDRWIQEHKDEILLEIEGFFGQAIWRVANPDKANVTKPVIDLKTKGSDGSQSNIRVWVYDAHQGCQLSEQRSFQFGHDNTAGIIYENIDTHGHQATDKNLGDESTWGWIEKWMKIGLASKGYLNEPAPEE